MIQQTWNLGIGLLRNNLLIASSFPDLLKWKEDSLLNQALVSWFPLITGRVWLGLTPHKFTMSIGFRMRGYENFFLDLHIQIRMCW